ncbi:tRNA (guanosine(46)-N7)-methyltransferase TrmB [Paracrocinitomix mangrovi]|uniref:tRNA (guanosine(46)-N7)-methyltransferase TrmB n=1 Tax=Paracrocinitomix mangrovi TaxID=2862509 RepID=UPI001C8D4191|nr:tRNA (guanosine(46)-N7)-methyltransferase TrmB [Paracrocinitomix mangrovi]UKN03555.1 tRNA (guanosine(46)-N7)-methyltransferase TrmB [Paracrocinitomix mangrovi]
MPKKKLIRFEDIKTMDWVVEPTMEEIKNKQFPLKGKWAKEIFKNDSPIVLELGCGKGEYAVGMGRKFPDKNFLGVDIKGARIWYGANTVREEKMSNVAFLRTRIDFIESFFAPNEISEIWLTFSDPQPRKPRKRLTSKLFIDRYRKFLKPGGIVHLKTDSSWLFASTLEQIDEHQYELISKSWDLYGELVENLDVDTREILEIKTHYEQIFSEKGHDIKYVKFRIN